MVIFCIGGVSGTGKTQLRLSDPMLRDLPCIDIADIYERFPNIGREAARREMMDMLESQLQYNIDDSIVLEAFFAPGKLQRRGVEEIAAEYDVRVRFIWCWASRDDCRYRVMRDRYRDSPRRHRSRLDFLEDVRDKFFLERPEEAPPCWLDQACDQCGDWPAEAPMCCECDNAINSCECAHCAREEGRLYTCSKRCRRINRARSSANESYGYHY